jgi:hypothetical protein
MSDDSDKRWIVMSARLRLKASQAILMAAGEAKVGSLARIEASWKLLDRARADFVIFNHCHQLIGVGMTSLSHGPAAAVIHRSDKGCQAAFGDLVITSADLEALMAGGGQTWDMPAEGSWPPPANGR